MVWLSWEIHRFDVLIYELPWTMPRNRKQAPKNQCIHKRQKRPSTICCNISWPRARYTCFNKNIHGNVGVRFMGLSRGNRRNPSATLATLLGRKFSGRTNQQLYDPKQSLRWICNKPRFTGPPDWPKGVRTCCVQQSFRIRRTHERHFVLDQNPKILTFTGALWKQLLVVVAKMMRLMSSFANISLPK